MLIKSNFSFSHSVFKRLVLQTCEKKGLFRKGLKSLVAILNLSSAKSLEFEIYASKIRLLGKGFENSLHSKMKFE